MTKGAGGGVENRDAFAVVRVDEPAINVVTVHVSLHVE